MGESDGDNLAIILSVIEGIYSIKIVQIIYELNIQKKNSQILWGETQNFRYWIRYTQICNYY